MPDSGGSQPLRPMRNCGN